MSPDCSRATGTQQPGSKAPPTIPLSHCSFTSAVAVAKFAAAFQATLDEYIHSPFIFKIYKRGCIHSQVFITIHVLDVLLPPSLAVQG